MTSKQTNTISNISTTHNGSSWKRMVIRRLKRAIKYFKQLQKHQQ